MRNVCYFLVLLVFAFGAISRGIQCRAGRNVATMIPIGMTNERNRYLETRKLLNLIRAARMEEEKMMKLYVMTRNDDKAKVSYLESEIDRRKARSAELKMAIQVERDIIRVLGGTNFDAERKRVEAEIGSSAIDEELDARANIETAKKCQDLATANMRTAALVQEQAFVGRISSWLDQQRKATDKSILLKEKQELEPTLRHR